MARPKKVTEKEEPIAKKEDVLPPTPAINDIETREEWLFSKDWISPEQFLNSKGIDPAIKSSPIQNVTFIQLCELLNEYKNA